MRRPLQKERPPHPVLDDRAAQLVGRAEDGQVGPVVVGRVFGRVFGPLVRQDTDRAHPRPRVAQQGGGDRPGEGLGADEEGRAGAARGGLSAPPVDETAARAREEAVQCGARRERPGGQRIELGEPGENGRHDAPDHHDAAADRGPVVEQETGRVAAVEARARVRRRDTGGQRDHEQGVALDRRDHESAQHGGRTVRREEKRAGGVPRGRASARRGRAAARLGAWRDDRGEEGARRSGAWLPRGGGNGTFRGHVLRGSLHSVGSAPSSSRYTSATASAVRRTSWCARACRRARPASAPSRWGSRSRPVSVRASAAGSSGGTRQWDARPHGQALAGAVHVGDDDGPSAGHRLQGRERHALPAGRQHHEVGLPVPGHGVVGADEPHGGGGLTAQRRRVRPVPDQHEPRPREPLLHEGPGAHQDVLALLAADAPDADHQRIGGGLARFGGGHEAGEVDAVGDDVPARGDPGTLSRRALRLADADDPGGPARAPALPFEGEPGGGAVDRLEGPGVRLEHGGDPAAHGEAGGESGLGAVRVDEGRPHLRHEPRQATDFAGDAGPGRAGRLPRQDVTADAAQRPGQGSVRRAGHADPHARGELCLGQITHDAGHSAVDGLGDMEDTRSRGCRCRLHARFPS